MLYLCTSFTNIYNVPKRTYRADAPDSRFAEKQFFWVREESGAKAEVDFILQYGDQIIPIEVKAGTNSHLKSLHSFVNKSKHFVTAIRFWSGEFFVQDAKTPAPDNKPYRLINIPFYYIGQTLEILGK